MLEEVKPKKYIPIYLSFQHIGLLQKMSDHLMSGHGIPKTIVNCLNVEEQFIFHDIFHAKERHVNLKEICCADRSSQEWVKEEEGKPFEEFYKFHES